MFNKRKKKHVRPKMSAVPAKRVYSWWGQQYYVTCSDKRVTKSLGRAQDSSVQDGICALRKAHMRSTPSLRSFPNVALETVPILVWLTMAISHPPKEDRWALPLSAPLSSEISGENTTYFINLLFLIFFHIVGHLFCHFLTAHSPCRPIHNNNNEHFYVPFLYTL